MRKKRLICAVEVGWRGIREYSLARAKEGIFVDILIKGLLDKEILEMITKHKLIRLRPMRRNFFRIALFLNILLAKIFADLQAVVVTKNRTKDWVSSLGCLLNFKTLLLVETANGYSFV
jgi:hypothetical protein